MSFILQAENIYKSFGGLQVLKGVHLAVKENTIHAMIGPNGAGKTTFLNVINGLEKAEKGILLFRGQNIFTLPTEKRAKLGIARTFQLLEIFGDLTVLENVMVALFAKKPWSILKSLFLGAFAHPKEKELKEKAMQLLSILGLEERAFTLAKSLPLGEQKLLEIARALALNPKLLLLDEPAAGLNHRETKVLGETLKKLKERLNLTILLVEHDMELVMNYSDWITVLNFGSILAEGAPLEIQKNPEVIKAYLGEEL
ncbi:MAG: ABC transporter ATP-binding protein [Caldimicrobium sp.]